MTEAFTTVKVTGPLLVFGGEIRVSTHLSHGSLNYFMLSYLHSRARTANLFGV